MKTQDDKNLDNFSLFSMEEKDIIDVVEIQNENGLSIWSRNDYAREISKEDSICKVVKFNNRQVIAFALVQLFVGSNESSLTYTSSEIYNIAVSKSFQGKGIGQKIFDEILRDLMKKSVLEIWLEVRESNVKALNFYRKNGFLKQFERKEYYRNPLENALILSLSLVDK